MHTKEANEKGDKAKSAGFEPSPMGHRMFEMMNACCMGQDGFPDCSTMMKGMMEAGGGQPCCAPRKEETVSERRKKK
jgi:hypothetical protein